MDRVIWTDAEAYMGRGIKDPENDHESTPLSSTQRIRESACIVFV